MRNRDDVRGGGSHISSGRSCTQPCGNVGPVRQVFDTSGDKYSGRGYVIVFDTNASHVLCDSRTMCDDTRAHISSGVGYAGSSKEVRGARTVTYPASWRCGRFDMVAVWQCGGCSSAQIHRWASADLFWYVSGT